MSIEEIKARSDKATPGPWEMEKYYHEEPYEKFIKSAAVVKYFSDGAAGTITRNDWSNPLIDDLTFIAHAREDIPYLLSLLEKAMQYIRKSQYFDCVTCANQKEHDKYPIPDVCSNCHVGDRNATNWRWRGLTE